MTPLLFREARTRARVFTVQDPAADPADVPAGVAVTIAADAAKSVELCALFVAPALRGQGVGRHLVLALADRCRAEGVRRMTAGSPAENVAALLVGCGFVPDADAGGPALCLDL